MVTKSYNPNSTDNQKELFVEVDENDNVIGPVSRRECHNETKKPWHRSVHVYLFDHKGEIYFTQRSMKKDTAPGQWTVAVGGHVSWGETPEEAAKKECQQELSIKPPIKQIGKLTIDYRTEREVIYIFAGVTSDTPKINPEEVEQIRSFPFDKIVDKFKAGEFELSGGSTHTFKHLIETGLLAKYEETIKKTRN